jgi:circadian clock protein KaiC
VTARKSKAPQLLSKAATGIQGFDDLSRGGLPRNRTSMVMGGPGTGKTVFALQALVNAAQLPLEHQPRCMVIDPLSAISRTDALSLARAVCSRIIYTVRDHNITAFITSLVEGDDPQAEATELQISTIADTWIHLSYLVRGGERNRALTIIKSRGTQHANQVRELVLSGAGRS